MPANSRVDRIYRAIKRETGDKGKAARIAQAKTGLSLKTGKPPMSKKQKARKDRQRRLEGRRI